MAQKTHYQQTANRRLGVSRAGSFVQVYHKATTGSIELRPSRNRPPLLLIAAVNASGSPRWLSLAKRKDSFQYAQTFGQGSTGSLYIFYPRYLFLPQERQHRASTWLLPDTLQHSILSYQNLGLWLRATKVGVAPTCFQTISSTHVHLLVRQNFNRF